jgi:tetratricopeptide (TPR) repeat protein
VNFDRLDVPTIDFWRRRYDNLPPPLQVLLGHASVFHSEFSSEWLIEPDTSPDEIVRQADELVSAGWLQWIGSEPVIRRYQFACRTARNFVRRQADAGHLKCRAVAFLATAHQPHIDGVPSHCSMWELHRIAGQHDGEPAGRNLWETRRGIDDTKLATLALLTEYRHLRGRGEEDLTSLAAGISDGFAELGSVRRQKRWAAVAFSRMRGQTHRGDLSISAARFLCHLHDLSGELRSKHATLSALLEGGAIADALVRGFLLSELGTVHLLQGGFQEANTRYFEAHHLLEKAAPESAEYVRNLNRLGLSLMRIGRYAAARKHLEQCRKLAQQFGFNHIVRLSLGNLVILERALGDARAAMRCSRRALDGYRSARDSLGYLRALPDKVMCQVDLGHGYTALRTAQLAVWLANLHSGQVELSYAFNNLGWILMMQGETGRAQEQLEAAIRLHVRTGDALGIVRSKLNLAWTFLLAGDLERAEDFCRSGLDEIGRQDDLHGQCEAMRILAQAAIMREDLKTAEECLKQIPKDNPLLSPRDQAETSLAWLNLYLWQGELADVEKLINDLATDSIVTDIHPLRCDFGRMRGMWYTHQGDHDRSLDILSATASDCRRGGRADKLIDTMIALVLLAGGMHNWPVGHGYLRTVTRMTDAMRGQLQS